MEDNEMKQQPTVEIPCLMVLADELADSSNNNIDNEELLTYFHSLYKTSAEERKNAGGRGSSMKRAYISFDEFRSKGKRKNQNTNALLQEYHLRNLAMLFQWYANDSEQKLMRVDHYCFTFDGESVNWAPGRSMHRVNEIFFPALKKLGKPLNRNKLDLTLYRFLCTLIFKFFKESKKFKFKSIQNEKELFDMLTKSPASKMGSETEPEPKKESSGEKYLSSAEILDALEGEETETVFGSKASGDEATEPSWMEGCSRTQETAKAILEKAVSTPLLRGVLMQPKEPEDNTIVMERQREYRYLQDRILRSVSSEGGEIRVEFKSLLDTIQREMSGIAYEVTKDIRTADVHSVLSCLAFCCSNNYIELHRIGECASELVKKFAVQYPESETDLIAILNHSKMDSVLFSKNVHGTTDYFFIARATRMYYLARYLTERERSSPERLFSRIAEYSDCPLNAEPSATGDPNGIFSQRLDVAAWLGTCVVFFLRDEARPRFLKYLLSLAEDFNLANRRKLEIAICILTMCLSEQVLSFPEAEEAFRLCFSNTQYGLQMQLFSRIKDNYPDLIRRASDRCIQQCKWDEEKGTLLSAPDYFFWYSELVSESALVSESENCLYQSQKLRMESWQNSGKGSDHGEAALNRILEIEGKMGEVIPCTKGPLAYSNSLWEQRGGQWACFALTIMACAYAFANARYSCGENPTSQNERRFEAAALVLWADWYLRKFNPRYQDMVLARLRGEPCENVFMLSGTLRFASEAKEGEFKGSELKLPKGVENDYHEIFAVEEPRVRFLLARLLAFSDMKLGDADIPPACLQRAKEVRFSAYDHFALEHPEEKPLRPDSWRSH